MDVPQCECHGEGMYFNPDRRYRAGGYWRCREQTRVAHRRYYEQNALRVNMREQLRHHRRRLAILEEQLRG